MEFFAECDEPEGPNVLFDPLECGQLVQHSIVACNQTISRFYAHPIGSTGMNITVFYLEQWRPLWTENQTCPI